MTIYKTTREPGERIAELPKTGLSFANRLSRLEDERRHAEKRHDWKEAERLTEEITWLRARLQLALRPNSEARRVHGD